MINCLLTGIGGQGTVLASKLISQTAMDMNQKVRTAETIGMAQRGGSVVSHVRIGDDVYSPLIPNKSADVIIAFEPAEAARTLQFLKDDGAMIVSDKPMQPVTASLTGKGYDVEEILDYLKSKVKNIKVVDVDKICEECGSTKILNVALLGAAVSSGNLKMNEEDIANTIKNMVPEKFKDMNLKALSLGMRG